jgi:hypothetical protein
MSLNFELGGIANYKELNTNPVDPMRAHPVMEAIIWKSLAVDMGTITAANAEEFFWRVRFIQLLEQQPEVAWMDGREAWLTLQDIVDCIGLRTNVTTIASRTKWLAKFASAHHPKVRQEGSCRDVYTKVVTELLLAKSLKAAAEAEA